HDAEVRRADGAVRARERGAARHVWLRRRVLRDHRQLPRECVARVLRGDDARARRRLYALDGEACGVRRGRERPRRRAYGRQRARVLDAHGARGRRADRRDLARAARERDGYDAGRAVHPRREVEVVTRTKPPMPIADLTAAAPEIFLTAAICVVLLVDVFLRDHQRNVTYVLSMLALIGTAAVTLRYSVDHS